jgi:hypothetical protein
MFGWKLDPQGPSSLGGEPLGPIPVSAMNLEGQLFARSDGVIASTPLGTLTCRRLGPGSTEALAAHTAARSATVVPDHRAQRSRERSHRYRQASLEMNPQLKARLRRLGVGVYSSDGEHRRRFNVVDIPLR